MAVFIDAIMVKVREGQVANKPVYAAIGVTVDGHKDVLGLWAGSGGEGAKFWMSVRIDLKNRGVRDVFFVVCDGLKGLPDPVEAVWPQAIVQTCIIHLIRNTFRLTSRTDADAIKRDIKPIYTAVNADAALAALDALEEKWGSKYRAMIRLWRNAWKRVHPVPRLRRRNPSGDLLDERDRIVERTLSACRSSPWAFPERTSRHEMPVPCDPQPGPDRSRPRTMDDPLEARTERLRHHLR